MKNMFLKISQIIFVLSIVSQLFASPIAISSAKEPKIVIFESDKVSAKQEIVKKEASVAQPKSEQKQELKQELKAENNHEILKPELKQESILDNKQKKINTKEETIGFVFASNTIGKYGIEASNVAMTYLVNKNTKFKLEFFDIEIENKQNITNVLDKLKEKGIKKAIVLFTSNSLWSLNSYPEVSKFEFYLPLINKSIAPNQKQNFIFGGMDYKKQFNFLVSKAGSNIVEIYDDSTISKTLHDELVALNIPNITYIQVAGKVPNYKILATESAKIKDSTIILNTSIVKSSIILSHFRDKNIEPKEIFSTQLNYAPVIFNLTTEEDRSNLFIANSIGVLPRDLEELISFFGNDVLFSWVNYSVVLGLEYFMTNQISLFGNISIKENQVDYNIKKVGFTGSRFVDL